jgi:exonuclease III
MENEIKIISLNVRGLATDVKRRDVFKWLREQKCSLYCLQDIHCKPGLTDHWTAEWGYKCIFAPYKGDSCRGTAILFSSTLDIKIHQIENDPGGNFNIINLELVGKKLTLVNLYGPNRDDQNFYNKIK